MKQFHFFKGISMHFLASIITISIVAINIIGCGSGASTTTTTPTITENPDSANHVSDITRSERSDFAYDTDNPTFENRLFESSMDKLQVVTTENYVYIIFNHQSTAPNVQFFIDIDNDPTTGYSYENGSEYIIENNTLYVSKNNSQWDWEIYNGDYSTLAACVKIGEVDVIRFEKAFFETSSGVFQPFSVYGQSLDDDWIPETKAPTTRPRLTVTNQTYAVQETTLLAETADQREQLYIDESDGDLIFYVVSPELRAVTQLYIDADDNNETGFNSELFPSLGSDFMIENGVLFQATSQQTWKYRYAVESQIWQDQDRTYQRYAISASTFWLTSKETFSLGVEQNSADWSSTVHLPVDGSLQYTLQ